jgi:hypothetical protein
MLANSADDVSWVLNGKAIRFLNQKTNEPAPAMIRKMNDISKYPSHPDLAKRSASWSAVPELISTTKRLLVLSAVYDVNPV